MITYTQAQAAAALTALGFRVNTHSRYVRATCDFQTGWNLGGALTVDSIVGPYTTAALGASLAAKRTGTGHGTASPHFSFDEFACGCNGHYQDCRRIWVSRATLQMLESYRAHAHGPVQVTSGCRCDEHNADVGGVDDSQHVYGFAADLVPLFPPEQVKSWRIASGVGYGIRSGRVVHLDRRDISGHNTTRATLSRPTLYTYTNY